MGSPFAGPSFVRHPLAPFRRLPILILLISLLAAAFALAGLRYVETRLVEATGEALSLAAAEVADKVDRILRERQGDLRILAQAPVLRGKDLAPITRFLQDVKATQAPYYLWIGVTGAQGRILAATDPAMIGQDRGGTAWFRAVRDGANAHVADIDASEEAGGIDALTFTARLTGTGGEFLGVVTARVGLQALEEVLTQTLRAFRMRQDFAGHLDYRFISESGAAFIDSQLIYKGKVNLIHLGRPSAGLLEADRPGFVEEEDLHRHVPVLTGYARTKGIGENAGARWGILLHMDRNEILEPIRRDLWRLGALGFALWVPMLMLLLWAAWRLSRMYAYSQEREEWLAITLGSIGDGVIATDCQGLITFMNPVAQRLTAWTQDEARGIRLDEVFRIVNEETREPVESPVTKVLREGLIVGLANHTVLIAKDGAELPIDDSGAPIRDAKGRLIGVVLVFHDIAARRKAEKLSLAEHAVTRILSEAEALEDAAPKILMTVCETLSWNLGLFWTLDRSVDALRCAETWWEGADEETFRSFLQDSRQRLFTKGLGLPGRVWAADRAVCIVDVVSDQNFPREQVAARAGLHGAFGFPILLGKDTLGVLEFFSRGPRSPDEDLLAMMTAVGRQIGQFVERKEAECALAAEKQRLDVTLRSIGEGVIATDAQGRVRLLNPAAEVLTGWTQQAAQGQPLNRVFQIVDESTREPCLTPVEKVLLTGSVVGLANHTLLIAKDGTERLLTDSGAPIKAENGAVVGVVLVFRDVTEQTKLEQELLIARKLESVGILAGGIAHDFNNILTAILGNISLAKRETEPDGKMFRRLTEAENATLRATGLTQQLLTFSKGGTPVMKTSALGGLLSEWTNFALRGTNVRAEYAVPEDLWLVEIDEGQMSQVVHNLVLNARQAMPRGGIITITGENCILSNAVPQRVPLRAGRYVRITIQDQGTGIAPEHLSKIFDPYYTTKPTGNGLGLAMSFSIMKNHEGHIAVESQVEVGTRFFLYLPASVRCVPTALERERRAVFKGQGKVLVMDDEPSIRGVLVEMLGQCGYEAVEATDGAQALEVYRHAREAGNPFAAVIMDLTVPGGMGGLETIERLRIFDPDVRAIVSSGYATDPVMAHFERHGFRGMVAKPYEVVEFSQVLHRVIMGMESTR